MIITEKQPQKTTLLGLHVSFYYFILSYSQQFVYHLFGRINSCMNHLFRRINRQSLLSGLFDSIKSNLYNTAI